MSIITNTDPLEKREPTPDVNAFELWDTATLAQRLSVSRSLIEKSRSTGSLNIPFVRIGKAVRYPANSVSAWVEQNLVKE
jgi:predicted DNA-binding transcriptional regulator AlpA